MRVLALLLSALMGAVASAQTIHHHALPFVLSADSAQVSLVRIINQSDRAGTVEIHAIDDTGERFGPVALDLAAKQGKGFTSRDLERGGTRFPVGVGDGEGHWWLELSTTLDIEPLAYIRTADGFLTSMHDVVPQGEDERHRVLFFNPASNRSLVSRLRIVNPHYNPVDVTINAIDALGVPGEGPVRLTLASGASTMITSAALESGDARFSGRFGDGAGKWQLFVSSTQPVWLMNLMATRSGHISNLSLPAPELEIPGKLRPDLVVRSLSSSETSLLANQSFTLRATVHNQGAAPSASTTLRYYRSSDATITPSDTQVGSDAVSGLAASGSSAESISLTAPPSAGTYYYGACVESVAGESNTRNNCSRAVRVTVGTSPQTGPDLVVHLVSVSDSNLYAGQSFTLRATVHNQGAAPSASTTLRYYRSSDTTITPSDTQVGTDPAAALFASGSIPESIGLTAPPSAGTYYYGACVESVAGESNTRNNCSRAVRVTVGTPPQTGWKRSWTGPALFDLPVRIERIRIDAEYFGSSENFVVLCGRHPDDRGGLLVNTILGTYWGQTRYSDLHSARRSYNGRGEPCRQLHIRYAQGVRWTVSEVPVSSNAALSPAADSGDESADRAAVERARAQVLRSRVRQPAPAH